MVYLALSSILLLFTNPSTAGTLPRVFVFTDINIDAGDPDDRQSLVHLLWYADELQIEGIVPDRWDAKGFEACEMAVDTYAADYAAFAFGEQGFPVPADIRQKIAPNRNDAARLLSEAAADTASPLYVLVWGNMELFASILTERPGLAGNIRLITIGTGLMAEEDIAHIPPHWQKSPPCLQLNWNGQGRNAIYNDRRFDHLWWLEINWTYAGMFAGDEPAQMFDLLSRYGQMGRHLREVVKNERWAQYFRVGDTPSVLYLIDPGHDEDDPATASWAGRFVRPFPSERPHYYTDNNGSTAWDYYNPCNTWENHSKVRDEAIKTLLEKRADMYAALTGKLDRMYKVEPKR